MKKGNTIMYTLFFLCLMMGISSCDVHEFPKDPEKLPYTLHLNFIFDLSIHEEIEQQPTRSADASELYDMRYILNVYRSEDGENFSREADTTIIYTKHLSERQNHTIELDLPEGIYNFIIWADYVDKGTYNDKYYNTSNFAEITYYDRDNYKGCNDYKDAFRGILHDTIEYDMYSYSYLVTHSDTIHLERPLAKFKFIANDLDEFITRTLADAKTKGIEESSAINPENYNVVFRYNGFMPCSFNMFTNKPNDSWTGMSFTGKMVPINENEMELGFDYVLVNGTESKTDVSVEIYDLAGELLSSSDVIEVPLVRSKETIVRANFLTTKTLGSVGISADFNGDYNIEIQ